MDSGALISKQGPLGYVWLAANYDKKLSKSQLLSTDICRSTRLITGGDGVSRSTDSAEIVSSADRSSITLRVSGQLLLGIVRIYSRKTKYLLDDVNEILLKLKTSFKMSGINVANPPSVNLKPADTILKNLQQVTLHDQITKFDLLYQPDFQFDDIIPAPPAENDDLSTSFDTSIELGRNHHDTTDNNVSVDIDLQFDFDDFDVNNDVEEADRSIEVGRDAENIGLPDMSLLDVDGVNTDKPDDYEIDDFDLGQPLETIDDMEPEHNVEQPVPAPAPRVRRTGMTEDGELITNKRKLKIDEVLDIPIQKLKDYQESILSRNETYELSNSEKLDIIFSEISSKRRRLDIPFQIPTPEPEQDIPQEPQNNFDDDYDVDFDLSLPEVQPPTPPEQNDIESEVQSTQENVHSTQQIAEHLQTLYHDKTTTTLSELIESDLHIHETNNEKQPLGMTSNNKINHKSEASKCFFELLVLATNDCVELKQQSEPTTLGGDISITGRDRLYSFF